MLFLSKKKDFFFFCCCLFVANRCELRVKTYIKRSFLSFCKKTQTCAKCTTNWRNFFFLFFFVPFPISSIYRLFFLCSSSFLPLLHLLEATYNLRCQHMWFTYLDLSLYLSLSLSLLFPSFSPRTLDTNKKSASCPVCLYFLLNAPHFFWACVPARGEAKKPFQQRAHVGNWAHPFSHTF
jgi:hypothetical protein